MKKILITSVLIALVVAACGPTKPAEPKVDRVTVLENKTSSIMAEIDQIRRALVANGEAMDELRDTILEQLRDISADSARISVKFDTVESRLDAITERLDDSEFRLSNLRKEVNSLRISRTGTEFTRPSGTAERMDSQFGDPSLDSSSQAEEVRTAMPADDREAYEMAYNDYLRGDYALAASGFRTYLQNFPSAAEAEQARFNLAESLFNLGDFEGALEEYDTFILNHPDSPQAVNARYKKALSFLESNQTPSGVILLRQIINQYPESNESRLAAEKLRSLGLNP